jgi:uncharacterized protein YndB with AHSA1/START domain
MARSVASRELLAPLADVWAFVAEPYNLADWWPGISGVEPDRRGLARGARWTVVGPDAPGYFRKPQAPGTLLVGDVVPFERLAFELPRDRLSVELSLEPLDERRTKARLVTDGPRLVPFRGSIASHALERLHTLLRTGEDA